MINCEFPPIGGGAANMTRYFLKEAASRAGLEVDLVTSTVGETAEEQPFGENITLHKLHIKKRQLHYWTQSEMLNFLMKGRRKVRELTREKQYNLTHAIFGFPSGLLAHPLRSRIPYIVSLRGSDVPGFNKRFSLSYRFITPLIKRIWKHASGITTNSSGLTDLAHITSPNLLIVEIPNGVDTDEFYPREGKENGTSVLCVSRLIERKGVHYLVESFADVIKKMPRATLTIAGSGIMKRELERMANERGLSDSVKFLGEVPHERLPELYREHDILVLPSSNEGMSNVMLEAMASGLPVLTTDTGGTQELLGEGADYLKKESAKSITSGITEVLGDEEKKADMAKASLRVARKFSWSKVVDEYVKLYEKVAGK